jgi:hypothetical protein
MSKQSKGTPWHEKDANKYHDNSKCPAGSKITQRISGTGNKAHCPECGKLNNQP